MGANFIQDTKANASFQNFLLIEFENSTEQS